MQVAADADYGEDLRLRYRFLDLRRERLHRNIVLRSRFIASLRQRMIEAGFLEFQTPILTASSPEGARDYLVPSRNHPGKFYALPQAPQQFKQLLMASGFDRYFQIAPCFRDEDARADRSPGEFYQLDFEMAFVTQEDVFAAIEPVLAGLFVEFGGERTVSPPPFPRIGFEESLLKYGTDKPDLRNPLVIADATEAFRGGGFSLFAKLVAQRAVVRAVPAPGAAAQPRAFFDKLNEWARDEGMGGLGYIVFEGGEAKGPIAKNLEPERVAAVRQGGRNRRRRRGVSGLPAEAEGGEVRRAGAGAAVRRARLARAERLPLLLDRRFPDVRVQRGDASDRVQPQPVLDAAGRACRRWKPRTR